ncbi:glutaminase, partial [Corynebacterium diphtheriae]
ENRAQHHTRSAAWLMKSLDTLDADPETLLEDIATVRAAAVTVEDLALLAGTLAHGGVHPVTGDRVLSEETVRGVRLPRWTPAAWTPGTPGGRTTSVSLAGRPPAAARCSWWCRATSVWRCSRTRRTRTGSENRAQHHTRSAAWLMKSLDTLDADPETLLEDI